MPRKCAINSTCNARYPELSLTPPSSLVLFLSCYFVPNKTRITDWSAQRVDRQSGTDRKLTPRPKPVIERINSAVVLAFLNIPLAMTEIDHGFAQKTWLSLLLFATFLSLHPSASTSSPMTSITSTSHPSDPHNITEHLPPRSSKSLLASTWQVLDQVFPSLLVFA